MVRARLPNPDRLLRPGMLLTVGIENAPRIGAVGARAGGGRRGRAAASSMSSTATARRARRPVRTGARARRPDRDPRGAEARRSGWSPKAWSRSPTACRSGSPARQRRRRGSRGGGARADRRVKLSDLSVKRPVFAAVVAMLIAVVGIVGFFGLSVREYPDVDPPVVSVETRYIGAAASVVETRVTQVLEEQLAGPRGAADDHLALARRPVRHHASNSSPAATSTSPPTTCATGSARAAGNLPDEVRAAGGAQGRRRRRRRSCSSSSPSPAGRGSQLSDYVDRNLRRPLLLDRRRRAGVHRRRGAAGDAGLAAARAARRLRPDPGRRRDRAAHARMSSCPPAGSNRRSRTSRLRVERPFATPRAVPRSWSSAAAATAIWSASATSPGSSRGRKIPIRPSGSTASRRSASASSASRAPTRSPSPRRPRRRPSRSEPTLPEGMTIAVGSDESPVHRAGRSRRSG